MSCEATGRRIGRCHSVRTGVADTEHRSSFGTGAIQFVGGLIRLPHEAVMTANWTSIDGTRATAFGGKGERPALPKENRPVGVDLLVGAGGIEPPTPRV